MPEVKGDRGLRLVTFLFAKLLIYIDWNLMKYIFVIRHYGDDEQVNFYPEVNLCYDILLI